MRYHSRTARPVIVVVDSEDSLHDDHFAYSIVMNSWWPFHTHTHLYRCSYQPVNDRKSAGGKIILRSTEQNPVDEIREVEDASRYGRGHIPRCKGGSLTANSISLRFFRFVRFALLPKFYPPLRTNLDDIIASGPF